MHRSLPLQVWWLLKELFLFIITSLHFLLLNCIKPSLKNLLASSKLPFWLILEQLNVARKGLYSATKLLRVHVIKKASKATLTVKSTRSFHSKTGSTNSLLIYQELIPLSFERHKGKKAHTLCLLGSDCAI